MKFDLGVNTGFAVNRFCEPKELFGFINKDLKIKNVQLSADLLSPYFDDKLLSSQIKKFKKEIKKNNINVSSIFTGAYTRLNHLAHTDKDIQSYWIKWFKKLVNISSELECPSIGSHFGIFSYKDNNNVILRKKRRRENINNWHVVANFAKKKGLKNILWEPMSISREQGETINECKKLQRDVNLNSPLPFKICLDVDHGELTSKNKKDFDPYSWLKVFAKEAKVIHLKQSLKDKGGHWPFINKYNRVGKIKAEKVISTLLNNGCKDAELILELNFRERNPADKDALKNLKKSVNYWKKHKKIN